MKIAEEGQDADSENSDEKGQKAAITAARGHMRERNARTFGELIEILRCERVVPIKTDDRRLQKDRKKGPREYRGAVRNKAGHYEHCADRTMIREEFAQLWDVQKRHRGPLSDILTDSLRRELDDESTNSTWRHRGILFGQRRTYWDTGTLGRCDLEPTERCVPHADMYASRYLVVETVNNLKIIERGKEPRPLTSEERSKINKFLGGPLGVQKTGKQKGQPKRTVSVTDLRELMGTSDQGWGKANKNSRFRFNIESDEDRLINTDWFSREIIHCAFTEEKWFAAPEPIREGINRAILKHDPELAEDAIKLKTGVMQWAGLTETQADRLVAAWKSRPKLDAKRLKMSRRAVRNILVFMDRPAPWPVSDRLGEFRWLTQIEARKLVAEDAEFKDTTTGEPLTDHARQRYATGAKGATAGDRYYTRKHLLKKNGEVIFGPDGMPLSEPPPAPLISNPVVRKTIHEVRRHLVEYMTTFERKPDEVYIELAREAKMGKKDADALLFRNRLRNRIRHDIIATFDLDAQSSTQQRAAVDRVVLASQQGCICALCGKTTIDGESSGITLRTAAMGQGCEVAHIIPRASGGHNGLGNIVLAHTKCNRDMERRTPREYWEKAISGGFATGVSWIEKIYREVNRPKTSEIKAASADALWKCYFDKRDDRRKIEQFTKDIKDIQEMTNRQDAATKYATRQVMAYLADALFDGKGLPERGGERLIYATDGFWTSRLRREWGLFFDPHQFKAKGLTGDEEHLRKEKNRGDHRHHAIDAIVTALCTRQIQLAWEQREKQADVAKHNTADEQVMEHYRRQHPLPPPPPFNTREEFREAVRRAVCGDDGIDKPICHRPVKRKLIGALHKATQYGPILDIWKQDGVVHRELVQGRVTVRQNVLGEDASDFLKPSHLRIPRLETDQEAVERLARRYRIGSAVLMEDEAIKAARKLVKSKAFTRAVVDPKPEKGGIVRDAGLRRLIRTRLEERGLNPDSYTKLDLKKSIDIHGPLTMGPLGNDNKGTGVPIYRIVLLWANSDPVTIRRTEFNYKTGERRKLEDPGTYRLYDSQNNHHIEIRVTKNKKGMEVWSGQVITTFEAAQRKITRLRAFRSAGIPSQRIFRKLTKEERLKFHSSIRAIEQAHPLVDRSDNDDGHFVMSLCEGEMLLMKHKGTGQVGYFVVAKLDKPQSIVLVPHWDARAATERKDAEGRKVPDSKREQFSVTPTDLKQQAAPGQRHAVKVRVSPLGVVTELHDD